MNSFLRFYLLSSLVVGLYGQNRENNVCERNSKGVAVSTCQKQVNCQNYQQLYSTGKLKVCGFANAKPLYCCAIGRTTTTDGALNWGTVTKPVAVPLGQPITPSTSTTTTTTKKPVKPKKDPVTVTNEMCKKYAAARFKNVTVPPLLIGEEITYRLEYDCVAVQTTIIGGVDAEPKEFPHMALIGYKNKPNVIFQCGGTLISENFILSAAHCTSSAIGKPTWARLGEFDRDVEENVGSRVDYQIIAHYNHPKYNSSFVYHDIALYKLATYVVFNAYMRPACLSTVTFSNTDTIATGWGILGEGFAESSILQKVTVPLVSHSKCKQGYVNDTKLPNGLNPNMQICAGEDGKDTCVGDSGGPLQIGKVNETCLWYQIGITSYGPSACGSATIPGVYTNVAYYIRWIQPIVWP